jgi:hypothetical protein
VMVVESSLEMVKVDMLDDGDGVGCRGKIRGGEGWDNVEEASQTILGTGDSHGLFGRDMRIFSGAQLCCPVIDGRISRWIQMRLRRGRS